MKLVLLIDALVCLALLRMLYLERKDGREEEDGRDSE